MSFHPFRATPRKSLAVAGIGLAVVLFLAINLLASTTLTRARLDLTEGRLYTLSQATRTTLKSIAEPIALRLYISEGLRRGNPAYADHVRRVREMLARYVRVSSGMLELKVLRPEPYSAAEDQAVADGLRAVPLGDGGRQGYFGLAGSNSTDDRAAIPIFAPERARFLEYDLTGLIRDLANPVKPVVGLLGTLPLQGDMRQGQSPWRVAELIREGYALRRLDAGAGRIPEDVDILLLAQPAGLSAAGRYAVDQFVQRGGPVLAFVDPFSELQAARRGRRNGSDATVRGVTMDHGLLPLLESWGVRIDPDTAIGDRGTAQRVRTRVGGRNSVVDFVGWLSLSRDHLNGDDPVTAQLSRLDLRSAGAIEAREGAGTTVTPLITSSPQTMRLSVERLQEFPNPAELLASFESSGRRRTLAARIAGATRSAFPDGPPEGVDGVGEHRPASGGDARIVLVAESDLLADAAWTRRRQRGDEEVATPVANNGDFVVNALDDLSGGPGLIGLRGRGLVDRPFTLIEDMRRAAEARYRSREQALIDRIETARKRMRELRREEAETGAVMTRAQEREMAKLQDELLAARRELREVQHKLHEDVERVQTLVRAGTIWGMPALVALVALAVALVRRLRRRGGPAAAG